MTNNNKHQDTSTAILAKNNGLNPTLALEKKRTTKNLIALGNLHKKINALIYQTNELTLNEIDKIKTNMSTIESIEFQMQKEWGFDLCRDKHTHWKKIKHCKCSKITGVRHLKITKSCPIHTTQTYVK